MKVKYFFFLSCQNCNEKCHYSNDCFPLRKQLRHQFVGTSTHHTVLLSVLMTSKVHLGHHAAILVWHRACILIHYKTFIIQQE